MTLFAGGGSTEHVSSAPRQVYDVTGAGDTVLATLSLALSRGGVLPRGDGTGRRGRGDCHQHHGYGHGQLSQLEAALGDRVWA